MWALVQREESGTGKNGKSIFSEKINSSLCTCVHRDVGWWKVSVCEKFGAESVGWEVLNSELEEIVGRGGKSDFEMISSTWLQSHHHGTDSKVKPLQICGVYIFTF